MKITGTVYEYGGGTLPGTNVYEVGTTNAVSTDANGKFLINVAGPSSELKFSFIGYDYDTYVASQINGEKVYLYPSTTEISEVEVPNPYKKKDNTIWWVLGALGIGIIAYKIGKEKPQKVKV